MAGIKKEKDYADCIIGLSLLICMLVIIILLCIIFIDIYRYENNYCVIDGNNLYNSSILHEIPAYSTLCSGCDKNYKTDCNFCKTEKNIGTIIYSNTYARIALSPEQYYKFNITCTWQTITIKLID